MIYKIQVVTIGEDGREERREITSIRVFFSDLTREPLQYLIRSHF